MVDRCTPYPERFTHIGTIARATSGI